VFSRHYRVLAVIGTALLVGCQGFASSLAPQSAIQQQARSLPAPDPSSGYHVVFSLNGTNGNVPRGPLVENGNHGPLYGVAQGGGTHNDGTIFTVTAGGRVHVVLNFDGNNGADPNAGLVSVNGALYGTMGSGGTCGTNNTCGTVFKLTRFGKERVLYRFKGAPDGFAPTGQLIAVQGTLYGTTGAGGAYGAGTVYSISLDGQEHVLYSFKGGAGTFEPNAGLVFFRGQLFGTTAFGGEGCISHGCGTVFSVTPEGIERTVYLFKGPPDGEWPHGRLTLLGGRLYGETYRGGNCDRNGAVGCGALFSVTAAGKERILYNFARKYDGIEPTGGLTAIEGTLYGVTPAGGRQGQGTVFSFTLPRTEKVLYNFKVPYYRRGGSSPMNAPALFRGMLYGTAQNGGEYGDGVVFALLP
jgi:uncharacterized repeat protein (TIGR03803 family)